MPKANKGILLKTHSDGKTHSYSMADGDQYSYSIHTDFVKILSGTHVGENGIKTGSEDGFWVIEIMGEARTHKCSCSDIAFVPKPWICNAERFNVHRLMQHFCAPGQCDPVPYWDCGKKSSPPTWQATLAFWGNKAYDYMWEAVNTQTHSRKPGPLNEFLRGQIWSGLVWSDCKPHHNQVSIDFEFEINDCDFEWWPCLFSRTVNGTFFVYCQDFAFTHSRPWLTHSSRCRAFKSMTFPLLNVVSEAIKVVDDYESLTSNWGGLMNIGLGADDTPTWTATPSAASDAASSDWSDSRDAASSDTDVPEVASPTFFSLNVLD